ncbi:MAG: 30S ribosomal protein S1 [Cycloclasticus sp.]|nr:30S ribosomal protein S1 [Cycloclasticus sp.]
MSENFAELFEESIKSAELIPGTLITGQVVDITNDSVIVNAGLKSEGNIPRWQFVSVTGELEVAVGDEVEVVLDMVEDGLGATLLSRDKAKKAAAWRFLEKAAEEKETVTGVITGKVRGGFTVEVGGLSGFLPGSLVDVRPLRDTTFLEGKDLEFKVIKLDEKRNNVVVSRRAVLETEYSAEREALLENLKEGAILKGVVKNLTDYGAFIDLGGVDGLLHITDMAWKRVKHPSEVIEIGQDIEVVVLRYDEEKKRVSLGMKQLGEDPWVNILSRYPVNSKLSGRVTNLTDYGCFIEIEDGIEGLVHVSEMDWTNKNVNPAKVVSLGDEVEVMVLEIDDTRRRISLGMKQCKGNPWEDFSAIHRKGDKIKGLIKSITDFGVFIGLDGDIDGLVHLSDISWDEKGEEDLLKFKKGMEIETVILAIDSDRERISLGIKQIEQDPLQEFLDGHSKNSLVKGTVKEVDAKGAVIQLTDSIEGYLRVSELSRERVEDARNILTEGDEVEAKFIGIDRKTKSINLSIKAKDNDEEKAVLSDYSAQNASTPTLGDIFKNSMKDK